MENSKVFVIGITGKRLMPTTPRKARKLLAAGNATVACKRPFTIQLNYKTGGATQPIEVGVDTGSQHIGIAVLSEERVLHKAEIQLRSSMEKRKLMQTRTTYRRGRRYRKTRYRHPKFRFHTKRVYSEKPVTRNGRKTHWVKVPNSMTSSRPEGWLPPSIQSKVDHHFAWIDRYMAVLPEGTHLNIEAARFDIAHMKDPAIHGELYQQGPQYGYENLKAYVFARDNYTCQCCKVKAGSIRKSTGKVAKLVMHHVLFQAEGATDNPEFLASVCTDCHNAKNHQPGGILYEWFEKNKSFKRGYRDATFMSILRKRIMERYPDARITYGNITAIDRKRLLLTKTHANDAVAIAGYSTPEIVANCGTIYYKQVRKKKRSLHEANPRKGRSVPNRDAKRANKNTRASKGFFLWDKVSIGGTIGWICGFSGSSSAYVVDKNGQYIPVPEKNYLLRQLSTMKALKHNNNWISYSASL